MERFYLLDGAMHRAGDSPLSPFDRAFMLGDALFETVKIAEGLAVWLPEHLARLFASCGVCGIRPGVDAATIEEWCAKTVSANGVVDGFARIAVSRGISESGRFSDVPSRASVVVIAGESVAPLSPVRAAFAPWRINETDPAVRHKSASRFSHVLAHRHAGLAGLDELVFLNTKGYVAEGIYSNVFWVREKTLFTPSAECGLLEGIARGKILDMAKSLGIATSVGVFGAKDVSGADEVFFTNSLSPVRRCAVFEGRILEKKCVVEPLEKMLVASIMARL